MPLRALRRAAGALRSEKERAQVTLRSIGDAVITTDALLRVEYLNPVAEALTGWRLEEVSGRPLDHFFRLVSELTGEPVDNPLNKAIAEKRIVPLANHTLLIRRDGTTLAIEDNAAPILDAAGTVAGGVLVFHDVSADRSLRRKLSFQASHDTLTGLLNRAEFDRRLNAALHSAKAGVSHVMCYLDLDQFKIVNDTCGHVAGDELLRQIAARLHVRARRSDTLARLGGDEFGLLLEQCPLPQGERIAHDVLDEIKSFRFNWENKIFTVGATIGLVEITADSESVAQVLSSADAACYIAKEAGRGRIQVHKTDDQVLARRREEMNWVTRITHAIDEDRFVLYGQRCMPLVPGPGRGEHLELLLRMIDERGAIVPPGAFIPAAERYDLMVQIDKWVIRTAFERLAGLFARSRDRLTMCAINLSGASINSEEFHDFLRKQTERCGIVPSKVCFEITETAAINNLHKAAQFIERFKALGFRFALDDFGSGMSSFAYLKNLPVHFLKIDGSFVKDVATDPVSKSMVTAVNQIGHAMGLQTTAEFVENQAIIDELRVIGVDFVQGYAVGKPMLLETVFEESGH